MGYQLHIVRRRDWNDDEEEGNIPLDEWLQYVDSDKELELTNGYTDIFQNWQDSPGFSEWQGHPNSDVGTIPWFDFGFGSISTKYPDDATIKKMIEIAIALQAKVQGDDGEFYDHSYFDSKEKISNNSDRQSKSEENKPGKKPWWKFW